MWDNQKDAMNQLEGTIVRKGRNPVRVIDVEGRGKDLVITFTYLRSGRIGRCPITEINVKPVQLGYINTDGSSYYLARQPNRRWKQGLDGGNLLSIVDMRSTVFRLDNSRRITALADTIMGKYPTLEAARSAVGSGLASRVAFSRSFAISKNALFYKGRQVGIVNNKFGIRLNDADFYLKELLEEDSK